LPKRHAPSSLSNLFAKSSGSLARITEKSQYLNSINQALENSVGATIAQNCRVSNYDQGILTIETAKSGFAMRLKFLRAEILSDFCANVLPDLVHIDVKVVPGEKFYTNAEKKASINTNMLSEQAGDYIMEAAINAPESLKRKLEKLARHAGK
jgi:hypothetical protein